MVNLFPFACVHNILKKKEWRKLRHDETHDTVCHRHGKKNWIPWNFFKSMDLVISIDMILLNEFDFMKKDIECYEIERNNKICLLSLCKNVNNIF